MLLRSLLGPGLRRGTEMKQINVWPMLMMLILIIVLIIWLRPH
jgi:biopolymer transport protein ExbD